ncbi:MAG: Asp-tRNA(Asn)/Glu-tRNA(Gln) amidotransferase GatCAB subunit A [Spirochaetae bacterium HGW-Spirochaetae-1]|jgi:aspartyl-tRNA(Asn)/glutamyl-tRNA(Gln) amidotransferase subunit A|nr:MAG: Asp-tRNA(Asn)/Glu-tRNA(Gln) amidotransferase GatCAB subunit A [Spirochaetae bacterium HGW-Spirochaetae-1]
MIIGKSLDCLADLLEKGDITSVEIVREYLDRINTVDPGIHAFLTVPGDELLSAARASDMRRKEGKKLSRFDGIPVAVKDNINTIGVKTTCASRMLENFVPSFNATAYQKMADQGFLLLGKTNMDEFAMGSTTETSGFGPTRNPYDRERVPGGSSGGSAAAVASMMAPAALGSDTGGSIRQPAAFCGVVGIKPTYGRVSRYGLVAFASSLDQIGTFAGNVDGAARMLGVISGIDKKDGTSIDREIDFEPENLALDMNGITIGVPDEYFQGIDGEIADTVRARIETLRSLGARIEKISLKYTEYAIPIYYLIATAEASSNLARYDGVRYGYRSAAATNLESLYLKSRSEGFGTEVKRRIILGTFSLSSGYYDAYYLKALKGRALIIEDFRQAFSKVDAIITPVTTTPAFRLGEMVSDPLQMYMSDILTISANLAGIPGISVPAGLTTGGLPIGLQIMGSHFRERTILSIAKVVEQNSEIRPPAL